ncbi:motility associated factor glycosyltransferase family protein [uncultured Thalassolituus sp.]|uniref:motility associated factor glycosyltransferase family protein n=1 Tax=uncultured Thalassolituus sp. TaxID=285273 RepID=UPI002615DAFE|nr:6-hydroxymethylpterin diphosphokinase MptE-like protein [uncultured Thalassolituus sp.]
MTHPRAAGAMALKDKNLAFFKNKHPALYQTALQENFSRLTLNIDGESGKVDLWLNRQSLYKGDAHAFAEKEVAAYKRNFGPGESIATILPPRPGAIGFHRFFSKRMHALTDQIPEDADLTQYYSIPDFYPMIAFFGCGLGIHIEKMIQEHRILNVIIFEPDPEYFFASLYVTDWENLFKEFERKGNKIDILVASGGVAPPEVSSPALWNLLINYGPSFPLCALFYNHISSEPYSPIIKRIQGDMHFFLNQWGYYDDEINQLNNALHNIGAGVPPMSYDQIDTSLPAVIVGGGPSFDMRVEEIKRHRSKMLLISCGTAVHSIIAAGLMPDIHVEIESHMLTYDHLSKIEAEEFFENTLLVGALQLPPQVFGLFRHGYYFLKDSTALGNMFGKPEEIVHRATPTCTNTGVAIATHLKLDSVFLYGMDFGFPEKNQHHSKNSIYFSDKMSDSIKEGVKRNLEKLVETESVHGDLMYTFPMYNTSRMSIEQLIKHRTIHQGTKSYACSEGAKIANTNYLTPEDVDSFFSKRDEITSTEFLKSLKGTAYTQKQMREKIKELATFLTEISRSLTICLNSLKSTEPEDVFRVCHTINMNLIQQIFPKYGLTAYFIRGSIWHYLNVACAHSLSIENQISRDHFINAWKENFGSFLKDLPAHFDSITSKTYPDSDDPWIRNDIVSNEHLYAE